MLIGVAEELDDLAVEAHTVHAAMVALVQTSPAALALLRVS
jgi:hypothetical protein